MKAGLPFTVALTPDNVAGIWPEANSGALFHSTPAEGKEAGARFDPLIAIHAFCAMTGPPLAIEREEITGELAAADPEMIAVMPVGLRYDNDVITTSAGPPPMFG